MTACGIQFDACAALVQQCTVQRNPRPIELGMWRLGGIDPTLGRNDGVLRQLDCLPAQLQLLLTLGHRYETTCHIGQNVELGCSPVNRHGISSRLPQANARFTLVAQFDHLRQRKCRFCIIESAGFTSARHVFEVQ